MDLEVRSYGAGGPLLVALHGGPGAPGTVAPLARALAGWARVVEPFQRRSGGEPLTVARHVDDLRGLVEALGEAPALVGSSWGAMLALAFAAAHPGLAGPLVLVGCGTFDERSRQRFQGELEARLTPALRRRLEELSAVADPDERLAALGEALLSPYSVELSGEATGLERCDARGHEESWRDMLRLQAAGVYPAAFSAIRSPALLIQGDRDPHPGALIFESLRPHLPRLEYLELARCGHYPWLERGAREGFLAALRGWLEAQRGWPGREG